MTALSTSMLLVDYGRWPLEVQIGFGGFATFFFGWCTLIIVRRLFESGPMLRIDEQGIWWRPLSDAVIPWAAVREAWISRVRTQKFISIDLIDPQRFKWKGRFRFLQPLNVRMGFGDVTLSAQGLDCDFDKLRAAVAQHVSIKDERWF
jgi:hypothetical protein